jgi:hypothetical protein
MEIFISGNIPSSKNSKQFTGKYLISSKVVKNFLKSKGIKSYSTARKEIEVYKTMPDTLKDVLEPLKAVIQQMKQPCIIEFHFVRDSKRKFDFHNMVQLPLDLMTAYDIIEDDNMDYVIPMPYMKNNQWYSVDKEKAGVYIRVGEVLY